MIWRLVLGTSERRGAAMRANYSTTANLEARQSLLSHATGVEGTHVHDLVGRIELGSVILDVGCGNGTWLAHATKRGEAVGLDLSWPILWGARRTVPDAPLAGGDAQQLPVRDGSVDVVLALWMLYHVPDKPAALAEAARVLRAGGRLIAATNAASEQGPHFDIIRQSLTDALGRPIEQWLEPLDFNEDNGADILRDQFADVDRYRWKVRFEVPYPEPLVAYLNSGRAPIEAELGDDLPWDDILARADELTRTHLADHGTLRFTRTGAGFVAHQPADHQ